MRIFGPTKEEVTGSQRKLPNEKFHNSYSSPNIICDQINEAEMGGACCMHGGGKKCIQNLSEKPVGIRPLQRTGHR
jgi:hypothetical protein